jgi:hypothetical protein
MKESVTIDEVIDILNELGRLDGVALNNLVEHRIVCNSSLAAHPTVQVIWDKAEEVYRVGFLGFVNGLFGVDDDGYGPIVAGYEVACPNGHDVSKAPGNEPCPECKADLEPIAVKGFIRRPSD